MGRFYQIIAATVVAGAATLFATAAAPAAQCPTEESFFGTIQRVNGTTITVKTPNGHYADVRIISGARMNMNGNTLRPGTFAGLYGCVEPGGIFRANEVTLSANDDTYHETLTGTVQRVESGRIIVRETGNRSGTWLVPDGSMFKVGQSVTAVGFVGANGVFYPQSINNQSISFQPPSTGQSTAKTITLSGVVQKVGANTLVVWEPSVRHSGMWVVHGAGRFKVGQHLTATGTEDRQGHFYPSQISIQ